MMPHINELAKGKDKWQRDMTRSVLGILLFLFAISLWVIIPMLIFFGS